MNSKEHRFSQYRRTTLFVLVTICIAAFCLAAASFAHAAEDAFTFSGGSVSDSAGTPASIKLNKEAFSFESSETRQLMATSGDSTDAVLLSKNDLVWASSDPKIATVTSDGLVTAVSRGTATITCSLAKDEAVKASCKVIVTANHTTVTSLLAFQSAHPYDANSSDLWTYFNPFAASIKLTFDGKTNVENGFDFIEVTDDEGKIYGRFTGTQLASKQVEVLGDSAWVRLISDDSNTEWGFAVVSVEPVINDGWYEYLGKVYFFRDGEMQKGMVNDGGVTYHFDEKTGEYIETVSAPTAAPAPEPATETSSPVVSGPEGGGPNVYKVPNLYFMDYDSAMSILNSMGLHVTEDWIYDDTFKQPYGTVIYQSRPEGADIAAGEDFYIMVSLGLPQVVVPDVVGKSPTEAWEILNAEEFTVSVGSDVVTSDYSLFDTVAWQEPNGGSLADSGSEVMLHYFVDRNIVPNVLGKTYEEASEILYAHSFNVAVGYPDPTSNSSLYDTVSWQQPVAGVYSTHGATVTLHFYGPTS